MHDKEAIDMMLRCKGEIESLRIIISKLQPKADAYDNLSIVLHLLPQPSQGYGEDLVWRLKNKIDELEKALATEIKPQP